MLYRSGLPFHKSLALPLWIPALASLAASVMEYCLERKARRRAKLGACLKCSYSRTGLAPSAVCPECGAAAPTSSSPA
jgi:hypothetical protein